MKSLCLLLALLCCFIFVKQALSQCPAGTFKIIAPDKFSTLNVTSEFSSIDYDSAGNIYAAGKVPIDSKTNNPPKFPTLVNFGFNNSQAIFTFNSNKTMFAVKYTPNLDVVWVKTFEWTGGDNEKPTTIVRVVQTPTQEYVVFAGNLFETVIVNSTLRLDNIKVQKYPMKVGAFYLRMNITDGYVLGASTLTDPTFFMFRTIDMIGDLMLVTSTALGTLSLNGVAIDPSGTETEMYLMLTINTTTDSVISYYKIGDVKITLIDGSENPYERGALVLQSVLHPSGDFIVSGLIIGQVTGKNLSFVVPSKGFGIFYGRFSGDGSTLRWLKLFPADGDWDSGPMVLDPSAQFFLFSAAGNRPLSVTTTQGPAFTSSFGGRDFVVGKMDASNGDIHWIRSAGGPLDEVLGGVVAAPDGNFKFVGRYSQTASFGPYKITASYYSDVIHAVLTSNGDFIYHSEIEMGYQADLHPISIGTKTYFATAVSNHLGYVTADGSKVSVPQENEKRALIGSTDEKCVACPPGSYSTTPGYGYETCYKCPVGTYYNSSSTGCVLCPDGTFSTAVGVVGISSCAACSPGSFSIGQNKSVCTPCPAGTYQTLPSSSSCILCPSPYSSGMNSPVGSSNITQCESCGAGEFETTKTSAYLTSGVGNIKVHSTSIDANANIYISGCFSGTFVYGSVSFALAEDSSSLFVMKMASNGTLLWFTVFDTICDTAKVLSMKLSDTSGFVAVAGTFTDTMDVRYGNLAVSASQFKAKGNQDMFFSKIRASDGTVMWTKTVGSESRDTSAKRLAIDTNNNIIIAGVSGGNTSFSASFSTPTDLLVCYYLIKYDSNGSPIWFVFKELLFPIIINALETDKDNNIYMAGAWKKMIMFGDVLFTSLDSYPEATRIFLTKYNSTGDFQWAVRNHANSDCEISSLAITPNGQTIYIAGTVQGGGSFFGRRQFSGYYVLLDPLGYSRDAFLATYDSHGELIQVRTYGSLKDDNGPSSVALDGELNVYLTSLLNYDRMTIGDTQIVGPNVDRNVFIVKFRPQDLQSPIWYATAGITLPSARQIEIEPFLIAGSSQKTMVAVGSIKTQFTIGDVELFPTSPDRMFIAVFDLSCAKCAVGTYNPTPGATSCIRCPKGTYRNFTGGESLGSCTPCPSGTYNDVEAAPECKICPGGTYSKLVGADSASACLNCPAGWFSTNGSTECQGCPKGTYAEEPGSSECTKCPAGTYSFAVKASASFTCVPCATGTYSNKEGAQSISNCTQCDPGTYAAEAASLSCPQCPPGSYSGRGASLCTLCLPGQYQESYGTTKCSECPPGTYQPLYGATNKTSCLKCPAGTYSTTTGASGSNACFLCPKGSFSNNGSSACTLCPAGFYSDVDGWAGSADQCTPCPAGTFSSKSGASGISDCRACSPGTFAPMNSTECSKCPAGSAAVGTGNVNCTVCTIGIARTDGAAQCDLCGQGQYRNSSTACALCPKNYYNSLIGATSMDACLKCSRGSVSDEGAATCKNCDPGTYHDVVNGTCAPCPIGTVSGAGAKSIEECEECPLATWSEVPGASLCQKCKDGLYTRTRGAKSETECIPCPIGSEFDKNTGNCGSCMEGTYSIYDPLLGVTLCKSCPAGTYNDKRGGKLLTSCLKCPAGSVSEFGDAKCQKCEEGTVSTDGISCEPCEPGTHASSDQSKCLRCTPGTYNSKHNQTECALCEYGFYSPGHGAKNCTPCDTTNNMFCSVGATVPLHVNYTFPSVVNLDPFFGTPGEYITASSDAPGSYTAKVSIISVVVAILLCFLLGALIFLFIAKYIPILTKVKMLITNIDRYSLKHFTKPKRSPINQGTIFGGIMTGVFSALAIAILTILLIDLFMNNKVDRTYLVPDQAVETYILSSIEETPRSYYIQLVLYGFPNTESCSPSIVTIQGIEPRNNITSTFKANENYTCIVEFFCPTCVLSGSSQSIHLEWQDYASMASIIEYTLIFPHFYGGKQFTIKERVVPDVKGAVFKGSEPTIVYISLTRSFISRISGHSYLFSDYRYDNSSGYIATKFPTAKGSSVSDPSQYRFKQSSFLSFTLSISVTSNVFRIQQEAKQSLLEFLSKLAALVSAISSAIVIFMTAIERIIYFAMEKMKIQHAIVKVMNKKKHGTNGNNDNGGSELQDRSSSDANLVQ